jgi:methylglutaconyl-CoA hydratase
MMTTSTPLERVLYSVENAIARIALHRPEKRNALDPPMLEGLRRALARAEEDAAVKVIALGAVGNDFCAGLDVTTLQQTADPAVFEKMRDAERLVQLFLEMRRMTKPIVALVRGRALGGGCGLATACDIVLAAESAEFGYPEVRIGFVPAIVSVLLRRSVGEKKAAELMLSGRRIPASEAERLGLVSRVFPDAEFETKSEEFLAHLAQQGAQAMRLTKQILYQIDGVSFEAALRAAVDVNVLARLTEDFARGVAAFLRK